MDKLAFSDMVSNIQYQSDVGLKIEFRDCLKGIDNVSDFSISTNDDIYCVMVKLRNYSLGEVKKVFHTFVEFTEYSEGTAYIRKGTDTSIKYDMITYNSEKKGFYCKFYFESC
ncbi:hypothetical protein [Paenibacillus azoreducens]|uniref:Uncharacterized protein n=1 Tax=Paenibacillus azoreducens TaxID=116718 RepID=A0A919YAU5_9BACL|nr:hypothetical protein [Paenibacillus azoreducens]GIO47326.1 hypothetical protein J34TS1_20910 [Paenibacillus azoreducens]